MARKGIRPQSSCRICGLPVRNLLRAKGKTHSKCRVWNKPPEPKIVRRGGKK